MDDINIALLIDADNVSPRYIGGILSELSKYGKITVRRMYGDWSAERLHTWLDQSASYSLTPVMQPNNTPGKNASDIGLIIDAMDILYTGDVQGFCIVSSDGDFNKLATRLREAGKVVIGMGEKKTPESFRVSCERFIFLDVIDSEEETDSDASDGSDAPRSAARKKTRRKKSAEGGSDAAAGPAAAEESEESEEEESSDLFTDPAQIESAIVKMISDNAADGRETGLGEIGSRLVKIFPDFDIRNYHYSKLSEYLRDFPSLKVESRDNALWVGLSGSTDAEVESQIRQIFARHGTDDLTLTVLHRELQEINPNLDATIRQSGVTRFSAYLSRMIPSVKVSGRHVILKK